jgi:branched-chain amino acid transport system ATP-binding protein
MLEARNLRAGYHRGLDILQGVTIAAAPGKITSVLGANGVGKSTLLKAIFGFLKPTAGEILLDSVGITNTEPHRMVGRGIIYAPQQPGISREMSVEENLLIGGWSFRRDRVRLLRKLQESYERFPALKARRHAPTRILSGGQRRMVELARALMSDPRYLLIDEPSAGIAPIAADGIYQMLGELRDAGVGILLVDQDIRRALELADYVYVIDLGRNRLEGPPTAFEDIVATFWPGKSGR